jgi:hypothetical protein
MPIPAMTGYTCATPSSENLERLSDFRARERAGTMYTSSYEKGKTDG